MFYYFKRACALAILVFHFEAEAQQPINVSLPLPKLQVNSPFGMRTHPVTGTLDQHRGVDLSARCDPVLTILDGTVSETGFNPTLGKYIRIAHGEIQSIYGHLSYILVSNGEAVKAGDLIGVSGSTGRVTGEHLHFSIRFRDRFLNPIHFLRSLLLPDQQPSTHN